MQFMQIRNLLIIGVVVTVMWFASLPVTAGDNKDSYCFSTLVLILPSETPWLKAMTEEGKLSAAGIFRGLSGVPHIEPNLAGYEQIFKGLDSAGGTMVGLPRCVQDFGLDSCGQSRYPMEYFVPGPNGSYLLKTSDSGEFPGLTLKVTAVRKPDIQSSPPVYSVNYEVNIYLLETRESLPNLTLDVGKPHVVTKSITDSAVFTENKWQLMAALSATTATSGSDDTILVLGHVIPVETPDLKQ